MNMGIKKLFLLPLLMAGVGFMVAGRVTAQTFTTMHSFVGYPTDGDYPRGTLLLSGSTLYGTTEYGGDLGNGTVFAINTNGSGYALLFSFFGTTNGANPFAGLILSGNTLYGTASGGSLSNGTVFALSTDGTGFTNLYSFSTTSGPYPST